MFGPGTSVRPRGRRAGALGVRLGRYSCKRERTSWVYARELRGEEAFREDEPKAPGPPRTGIRGLGNLQVASRKEICWCAVAIPRFGLLA